MTEERFVDKDLLLRKVDLTLLFLRKELLKYKPHWCPAKLYFWWLRRRR